MLYRSKPSAAIMWEFRREREEERNRIKFEKNRRIRYDDYMEYLLYNSEDTVEYHIKHAAELQALQSAIESLSEHEFKMIMDCYFYNGKRPSYEELAKAQGISRQAYRAKLDRVLDKLRLLVNFHLYND